MKICMFVANSISTDARVKHEALALTSAGHDVTVVGLLDGNVLEKELWHNVKFIRVKPLDWHIEFIAKIFRRSKNKPRNPKHANVNSHKKALDTPELSIQSRFKKNILYVLHAILKTGFARAILDIKLTAIGWKQNAAVYHAHDLDRLRAAYFSAKLRHSKLVYDSHELWRGLTPIWIKALGRQYSKLITFEKKHINKTNLVITVADQLSTELQDTYKTSKKPLVIRNCSPIKPLMRSSLLNDLIESKHIRPIVLYQGGIYLGRGVLELAESANHVPEADFILIGFSSKEYKIKLENIIKRCAHNNIYLLKAVPHDVLWQYTCSADIGAVLTQPICLSYRYSLPNKIFQYMGAGLAVIASDCNPNHQQLAKETGAIVLTDPNNPKQIAEKVRELLNQPEQLRELKKNARYWAEKKYNTTIEMKKLVRAYREL